MSGEQNDNSLEYTATNTEHQGKNTGHTISETITYLVCFMFLFLKTHTNIILEPNSALIMNCRIFCFVS